MLERSFLFELSVLRAFCAYLATLAEDDTVLTDDYSLRPLARVLLEDAQSLVFVLCMVEDQSYFDSIAAKEHPVTGENPEEEHHGFGCCPANGDGGCGGGIVGDASGGLCAIISA